MDQNARFDAIKQKFLARLAEWVPTFDTFIDQLSRGQGDSSDITDTHMRIHKIAGSAKTFGFPELSSAAAEAEKHFDMAAADKVALTSNKGVVPALQTLRLQLQSALLVRNGGEPAASLPESRHETKHRHTILVADDDDLVRELLVSEFVRSSCQITQANDGAAVLDFIQSCVANPTEAKPDLILLDVNMPKVNGLEVLKQLKSTPATQHIPVVMLTRRDEDDSIINAISFGAVDYVTKPFQPADLVGRITEHLSSRKHKVLIADDDELIRELLSHRFQRLGTTVITAKSGPEALNQIISERPDAVVLDVMMPGMSGINVLKQMKEDDALKKIPVILLTAKSQQENILLGLASGAHDYITKPFDTDEVVARVNGIIQRSQNA